MSKGLLAFDTFASPAGRHSHPLMRQRKGSGVVDEKEEDLPLPVIHLPSFLRKPATDKTATGSLPSLERGPTVSLAGALDRRPTGLGIIRKSLRGSSDS